MVFQKSACIEPMYRELPFLDPVSYTHLRAHET